MTLIEFYSKDEIENICSSLTESPDRVILLGDNSKVLKQCAPRYEKFMAERGARVRFLPRTINRNNIQTIVDALSEIVEEYPDCVFDLTGGDDLYLVAAGYLIRKYKDRNIQMHRFNILNGSVVDVDQDGRTILTGRAPVLTVEEYIRIYGGSVIYDTDRDDATFLWDMNEEFRRDINTMWEICRKNVRLWNTQIGVFAAAEQFRSADNELYVTAPKSYLKDAVAQEDGKSVLIRYILDSLYNAGLLLWCSYEDEWLSLEYKNWQVKKCLTTAGQVLEMKVYLSALECRENDGSQTYNDALNGVTIDWEGDLPSEQEQDDHIIIIKNEIDVMIMHGMVPMFVSCKNGRIDQNELYKLNTVASRFGGKYAKKVLVATAIDDPDQPENLRQRAADMNIRIVDGFEDKDGFRKLDKMDDDDFNKLFRSLWSK